jgi:choline kinase
MSDLRAVMLVAGVGRRLGPGLGDEPKVLLEFGGRSLLARHLAVLEGLGVRDIAFATGYRRHSIELALDSIDHGLTVEQRVNADFERGSITSLWAVREFLEDGREILLMDGDVLYHPDILRRLVQGPNREALVFDRDYEPGDEPVKVCFEQERIVDFHKQPTVAHEASGEWVGFVRLGPAAGRALAALAGSYIERGLADAMYEHAVRDLIVSGEIEVAPVDVTGLPWIEIDFPDDVERAREEILPRLPESEQ